MIGASSPGIRDVKHIKPTSKPRRGPAPAASNLMTLFGFIIRLNEQIIEFLFKL